MAQKPILVTGAAAGPIGGIGRQTTELLLKRGLRVRALVHHDDHRADELRKLGAEVVVGDLGRAEDVLRVMTGCRSVYFGFSVSSGYLEATTIAAAVARDLGDLEVFVNMSQMTVSEMSLQRMTESHQQQQHWLGEQVLNWSGVPVVHVRPTVFLENPLLFENVAKSIREESKIYLPFGSGKTSPIFASRDVAEVVAVILSNPGAHVGKVYELTGPVCVDIKSLAEQYSEILGRKITYVDVPFDKWAADLRQSGLPEHVCQHVEVMAKLHAAGRYARMTKDVERLLGRPASSLRDFVLSHPQKYGLKGP